jgi:glycosyltransferase involved in cell wall biosynthesis
MRIVIDGRMILPKMSGVGRYLLGLSHALGELGGDLSYELWLQDTLPAGHPAFQLERDRFHLRQIPIRHMSLRGQAAIPFYLRKSRPDLFHYPHFDLPAAAPGKIVLTIHDLKYLVHPEFFPCQGAMKRLAIRLLLVDGCRRARRIICVSQSTGADLRSFLKVGREKVRTIPEGVEQRFFERRSSAEIQGFRVQMGLERPFILSVGERRPHKNLDGLLQAFDLFRKEMKVDTWLVIAGQPYADYRLPEQTALSLGLDACVRFIDHIPDSDLPLLYQAADCLVLLSYYEGFGLPVLEAMASGTPVVVSDRTSLPEVAGQAGLLVPADDPLKAAQAIASLVRGGDERVRCIEAGLERAAGFTWERCASLTQEVYREAVSI